MKHSIKSNILDSKLNTFFLVTIFILIAICFGFIYITHGYRTLFAKEQPTGNPTQQQSTLEHREFVPVRITPQPAQQVASFVTEDIAPPASLRQNPSPGEQNLRDLQPESSASETYPPAQLVSHPCGDVYAGAPANAPCNCNNGGKLEYTVTCPDTYYQTSYVTQNGQPVSRFTSETPLDLEGALCRGTTEEEIAQRASDPACSVSCFDTSSLPVQGSSIF